MEIGINKRLLVIFNESPDMIADTLKTPYYAVIFTSIRTEGDNGYEEMADKMIEFARQQDGFLGVESARNEIGITVSYWRDLDAIKKWKEHAEHKIAQEKGRNIWYKAFKTRIAKVESDYDFTKT
ncbi:MAG TPA: antibiotic biosynthesis monooxygenase [Prolixibacteraceae bacterium]|nr:antibiotic biosynthesis monooxygenase [Prolixibacteraceae bacterium]